VRIGRHAIGEGNPCFVIAEAGVNHNGDVALAKRLIDVAVDAGANAVKFQSFRAGDIVSIEAPKAAYQIASTGSNETQREMLERLELTRAGHEELRRHALDRGIIFCSTPFDLASVDLLEELGVPFFKVASGELTHVPLLRRIAQTGKPVVVSTGMSELEEVESALGTLRAAGARDIALLHCVSEYPANSADANLRAMTTMRERFGTPVGYSDHTVGLEVAVAAVALGASILEKHLTLDRSMPGPDHRASIEPDEFHELVREVRSVESALGDGIKRPGKSEMANRAIIRRGVFAAVPIPKGTVLTSAMLSCKRPDDGIPASQFDAVVGRRARRDLDAGQKLFWEQLD
jgi:N,N'-diacetyllegionaminate synthase